MNTRFERPHKRKKRERATEPSQTKPKGYEHLSWATIKAIADTCTTQADRAGQTQDEVFRAKGTT